MSIDLDIVFIKKDTQATFLLWLDISFAFFWIVHVSSRGSSSSVFEIQILTPQSRGYLLAMFRIIVPRLHHGTVFFLPAGEVFLKMSNIAVCDEINIISPPSPKSMIMTMCTNEVRM